jgi:hypothetical protein
VLRVEGRGVVRMTTKKQKREAAKAKREKFLAEERERGLAAQRAGRAREDEEMEILRAKIDLINKRHRTILSSHGIPSAGTQPRE